MSESAGAALIRVLIVEDSPVMRELLAYLLNADPKLQVIGVAVDGEQAVVMAQRLHPDVILMDIHLPKIDGFMATRKIMETSPTRIIMVTSTSIPNEVSTSFQALEAGALTILNKPPAPGHPDSQPMADELLQTIKLMAEVPVVKRWARPAATMPPLSPARKCRIETDADIRLIAIGASTGGPLVLQEILSLLPPASIQVPILIVQHIAVGFTAGFAEWLGRTTGWQVRVPVHGEYTQPGIAYLAPDGLHMKIRADFSIALVDDPLEHSLRPAVSYLFRSVASAIGRNAVGVLLTGMGRDGAKELKLMQEAGAVTIAQDKESSIVHGMPGEAVKLDAATYVLAPNGIAATLNWLVKKRNP